MRKDKKFKQWQILDRLAELGTGSIESFFPKNYSRAKFGRQILGFDDNTDEKLDFNKKNISNALSRLQKEGLVERTGSKKKTVWQITLAGTKQLKLIRENDKNYVKTKKDGIQRLVIFDIPEQEKKKRHWLRGKLVEFNYKMLQKSVWIGTSPLPEKFIHDTSVLKLQKHIHIFSIRNSGTIKSEH